jgi:hypothetical protein
MRAESAYSFRVGALLFGFAGLTFAAQVGEPPLPSSTNAYSAPSALIPKAVTPVDFFRQLLAMEAGERARSLADRPPESQRLILAKVREYESIKPDEREIRLRATELRWYLRPLMSMPATNRTASLALIPEDDRQLVVNRLSEWDRLSPEAQKDLIDNEMSIRYFTEIQGSSEAQQKRMLESIPPDRRDKLEAGISQWQSLPEARRHKLLNQFNLFFELTQAEKSKALNRLSEAERAQIARTLKTFGGLPPEVRSECIRSFAKFASLRLEERQQFLKNAEKWKLMSPDQRQAWRELVAKLPPPIPPETPPLPPNLSPTTPRRGLPVATNAGAK